MIMSRQQSQPQARRLSSKGTKRPLIARAKPFVPAKPFAPGTSGWTVADLDDPLIEGKWFAGGFEIIEGVLTAMPPAYYDGSSRVNRLIRRIEQFESRKKRVADFSHDADIVIDDQRVVRADVVLLTPSDTARFKAAAIKAGKTETGRQRIYAPPTLVIESASEGHQAHDRKTKFKWYAEFGVPNYWIFEPLKKSLDCFVLRRGKYHLVASGTAPAKVAVPLFDGLRIDLKAIFKD